MINKFDKYSYFFERPLYSKIEMLDNEQDEILDLLYYAGNIDAYNPSLKENTTYSIASYPKRGSDNLKQHQGVVNHHITSVRTKEELIAISYFDSEKKAIQKIGQYLSIADFNISKIKKYDNVLQKEHLKEFTRAIGLAANGVGIGSFVYLRRIFEKLLEEAHQKIILNSEWDEKEYQTAKVSDKIGLLKNYLPQFLVENKVLYGILSKGIHVLTEDECLDYFDTVKVGIELILDEKLETFEKNKKIEEARKRISSLNSKLR